MQVADDGTDYDYSVQQDYGSVSNYSTLRTATRYLIGLGLDPQLIFIYSTAWLFAPLECSLRALQKTGNRSSAFTNIRAPRWRRIMQI